MTALDDRIPMACTDCGLIFLALGEWPAGLLENRPS
jgi:hypothetical protein